MVVVGQDLDNLLGEFLVDIGPEVNDLVVTLVGTHETHFLALANIGSLLVGLVYELFLGFGDEYVSEVERKSALESHVISHVLDVVEELGGDGSAHVAHHVAYY